MLIPHIHHVKKSAAIHDENYVINYANAAFHSKWDPLTSKAQTLMPIYEFRSLRQD